MRCITVVQQHSGLPEWHFNNIKLDNLYTKKDDFMVTSPITALSKHNNRHRKQVLLAITEQLSKQRLNSSLNDTHFSIKIYLFIHD